MKIQKVLLVFATVVISSVCLWIMNQNFDRLARYPYSLKKETKSYIDKHLTDEEINYIIEYSIAPEEYIDYLEVEGFNIFRIENYRQYATRLPFLKQQEIIAFYDVIQYQDQQEVFNYLNYYHYDELMDWYRLHDDYVLDSKLVENPYDLNILLDGNNSVYRKKIEGLKEVNVMDGEQFLLREELTKELSLFCEKNIEICQMMHMTKGYVNYENLKVEFESGESTEIPGHSLYQLGLRFDIHFDNENTRENFEKELKNYQLSKVEKDSYRYFASEK